MGLVLVGWPISLAADAYTQITPRTHLITGDEAGFVRIHEPPARMECIHRLSPLLYPPPSHAARLLSPFRTHPTRPDPPHPPGQDRLLFPPPPPFFHLVRRYQRSHQERQGPSGRSTYRSLCPSPLIHVPYMPAKEFQCACTHRSDGCCFGHCITAHTCSTSRHGGREHGRGG